MMDGRVTHDVAHRAGLVRTATKPIRTRILTNPGIPDATKASIAQSLLFSRGFYNVGIFGQHEPQRENAPQ